LYENVIIYSLYENVIIYSLYENVIIYSLYENVIIYSLYENVIIYSLYVKNKKFILSFKWYVFHGSYQRVTHLLFLMIEYTSENIMFVVAMTLYYITIVIIFILYTILLHTREIF
jgi:hypothetical protein